MADQLDTPRTKVPTTVDSGPGLDRRRPGRVEYSDPDLIALLRKPEAEGAALPEIATGNDPDNLAPVRGIAIGLLAVAPFWAAIGGLCWWLSHR